MAPTSGQASGHDERRHPALRVGISCRPRAAGPRRARAAGRGAAARARSRSRPQLRVLGCSQLRAQPAPAAPLALRPAGARTAPTSAPGRKHDDDRHPRAEPRAGRRAVPGRPDVPVVMRLAAFRGKSTKIRGEPAQPILVDKFLKRRRQLRGDEGGSRPGGYLVSRGIGCRFSPCLPANTDQPILGPNSSSATTRSN